MLSVVVDPTESRSLELRSREDFHWLISTPDARWFSVGLRSVGEWALSDPLATEAYRFSWFSPDRTLRVGRITQYKEDIVGMSRVADGWPATLRRKTGPKFLDENTLATIRAQMERSWDNPTRSRSESRWLLESWCDGFYRAEAGWGRSLDELPRSGLSLLLLNDLIP